MTLTIFDPLSGQVATISVENGPLARKFDYGTDAIGAPSLCDLEHAHNEHRTRPPRSDDELG